mgnify:CR=1 FL=1
MYSAHMANSNVQHGPGAHTGFSARFDSTYEIALDRTRAVPKHSSILFRTISLFTDLSVAFVISPRLAPKQRIIALHRWRLSHLRGAGILSVSQRGHCGQIHVIAVQRVLVDHTKSMETWKKWPDLLPPPPVRWGVKVTVEIHNMKIIIK